MQGALSAIISTANTQHADIKKLLMELKTAMLSGNCGGSGHNGARLPSTKKQKLVCRIQVLQSAVRGKCIPGGFCLTHGHGVGPDHDSKTCNSAGRRDGHVTTATRANPVSPGTGRNKGWDEWIVGGST